MGRFVHCYILFISFPYIYISSKNIYLGDRKVKEPCTYIFSKERIQLIGASFSSEFTWINITRIVETKRLILFYHNSNSANLIPKKGVPEQDLVNLRKLIRTKPLIPSKLKG